MSKSIDRELLTYIRDGYFVCPDCDEFMELKEDDLFCPVCGYIVKREDYDYDYEEYFNEDSVETPIGCAACGGPYPYCKTSCKLFDD